MIRSRRRANWPRGPADAPRDVVIATKASMRATANPGFLDAAQHRIAVDTELKPQAASILSPEFAERLAAARRK
jgi:enoyl-CoA hydratase